MDLRPVLGRLLSWHPPVRQSKDRRGSRWETVPLGQGWGCVFREKGVKLYPRTCTAAPESPFPTLWLRAAAGGTRHREGFGL